ncbi:TonB-dependent receptor [Ramlibacter sp. MAHUQ-53]|uniref:TonB-dependent receptor n=1 Tax=unclassified Ramlibacter TaxID=2617605 RepID=UPI003637EB36
MSHPRIPFSRGALAAALACLGLPAAAQPAATLPEVTVTANPLRSAERVSPVDRLEGPSLTLRSQGSLGETLDRLPGVSSTYFGPASSRPVIRGLDGDRIRLLQNGGASLDVSGLSFDHAVPMDPLAVDRIEVLRGPATLVHGGSALGGVVNLIDNRIPQERLRGVTGRVDAGLASGSRERRGAAMVEGGNDRYALHVDAFSRHAGEVRVPAALDCEQAGAARTARRICNSQARADGGAIGGTAFFERGQLGASVASYRSGYGSPAEDEVTVGMRSDRYAFDGQWRPAAGLVEQVRVQGSRTEYRHTEFDAGAPGTVFRNDGSDLRVEARHRPLGPLSGVVGLHAEASRFAAEGDEAFAPPSRTRQRAVFLYEELATGWGRLSLGARRESVRVASPGAEGIDRFVPGERAFAPRAFAAGALWRLTPAWQLTANLARSERAPRDYELFANGPHVATGAWELGNATLGTERSTNLDIGAQWRDGPQHARVALFANRFDRFIALLPTGSQRTDDGGEPMPEYAYQGVPARFTGLEAAGTARLAQRPGTWDLEWRGDLVRASRRDTGEPLPRIAPARVGATLAWSLKPWGARLGFDHAARQDRVPAGDRSTPAYTLWHAALTRSSRAAGAELLWYARLDNAADRLAYSASSILTQTAPGRVPLPGRSLRVGVRADF